MSELKHLKVVWSRDKKMKGTPTGGTRICQLEGCGSHQICVKWPNGKKTWPCAQGMTFAGDMKSARIGFSDEWRKK